MIETAIPAAAPLAADTRPIPVPENWQQLGIARSLATDLGLKILYLQGEISLRELAERMKVSLNIIDDIFQRLRKEQLCEVKGMVGGVHIISATSMGKTRALELLALNQYVGPVPVSLQDYSAQVRQQSIRETTIGPEEVAQGFRHLVLSPQTLAQIGVATASGTSIFLYGPPGTGKTVIAETLPGLYRDSVWIPYALEVDGQIITVFDSAIHKTRQTPFAGESDGRWVACRRPRIVAGGELTLDMLDLQFNPVSKFYSAPLQMKANNGVLIIDDFGRQRMRPEEMLNRWIVPLDRRIDFLSILGGTKFEIPFDLFVAFATNMEPAKLVDDAFLRRIANKIKVDYVSEDHFHAIFRKVCETTGLAYDHKVVDRLIDLLKVKFREGLRPCYPRDVVLQIQWAAKYHGMEAQLSHESVEQACHRYFVNANRGVL